MGIFDKLFGKKHDVPENVVANETRQIEIDASDEIKSKAVEKPTIDTSQTPEKFLQFTEAIIDFLINKLHEINSLEQEIKEETMKVKYNSTTKI